MSDTTVWIIGLAFFAPLHYLGPTLVVFLTGAEAPSERATLLRRIVIDCSLSMLLAFALAVWLARVSLHAAAVVLLIAMALRYAHIWIRRRFSGRGSVQPPP
jgi:hypothetical protein